MPRPRRPGLGAALSLFLLVLVATTAWLGLRSLQAKTALDDARVSLAAARDALVERDVATARQAISTAGEDTQRARNLTNDPVWRLASALPGYGATVRITRDLAEVADELARDILPEALDGAELIDPATLRTPDGVVDLDVVRAATPPIRSSADDAGRLLRDLEALPTQDVVPQVADARQELQQQVAELADALDGGATALEVAPALLGEDRPRRYLMLVQQTGESRGTGGMPGGFVEIVADGGRLTAASSGSNAELKNAPVEPPPGLPQDYIDLYQGEGAFRLWQNINLSPDLPVVAQVVEAKWQAQGGQPLDGVAVVDGQALATILSGSGPITLPDGRSIAPEQLEDYLAVEQYRDVPLTSQGALTRKDQLADAAALVAARLTSGGGDTLSLLTGLSDAVRSGHLRLASDDPMLAPGLEEVDGALPRDDAPFTYPVVYNSTGGKLEHFLDRAVTYALGPCDGDRRRTTVTFTLTNQAPEGLPEYLTIRLRNDERTASLTNALTVQVYATRGTQLVRATLDGVGFLPENPAGGLLANDSEAGLPLWYTGVELPAGQPRTLVLELDEPVTPGTPRILEQPLSRPLEQTVTGPACS